MQFTEITETSQLICNGKIVQNKSFIAHGASANVFLSEYEGRQVVVKAIREKSGSAFYSEFQREADTMQMLWNSWRDVYGEQYPQVVPEFIGGDLQGEAPFIVEEFIDGKTLNAAMSELPRAVFTESQSLHIAAQIGRMLDILHKKLGRCYGDIKFNNFLVVGDVDCRRPVLKIIDWNVLTYPSDRNIQKDLLYVTKYITYIMTGYSVKLNIDQLEAVIPTDFTDILKNLSVGTQRFIQRGLHVNHASRYQTAQEWLDAVLEMDQYWDLDCDELVTQAQNILEMSSDVRELEIAQKKASVAQARNSQLASELLAKLAEQLSGDVSITNIKKYLASNNAKDAVRTYQSAMNRDSNSTNEELVLWGWLAIAADQMGDAFLDRYRMMENALIARLNRQFQEAETQFDRLNAVLPGASSALNDLQTEARVHRLISGAHLQQGQAYTDWVETLQQAFQGYQQLPATLQRLLLLEFDLPKKLEEAVQGQQKLEEAQKLCQQAENVQSELDYQLRLYKHALEITPFTHTVFTSLGNQVLSALNSGDFDKCQRLALVPRQAGKENDWFAAAVTTARELAGLRESFQQQGVTANSVANIARYVNRYHNSYDNTLRALFFSDCFRKFFVSMFEAALYEKRFTEAKTLSEIEQKIWKDSTTGERLSSYRDEFGRRMRQQVLDCVNTNPLTDQALDMARRILTDMEKLAGQPSAETQELREDLEKRTNDLRIEESKRAKEKENIDSQVLLLKSKMAQYDHLEAAEHNSPLHLRTHFHQQMPPLLFSIVMTLEALQRIGLQEEELAEWFSWLELKINLPYLALEQSLKGKGIYERKNILSSGLDAAIKEGRIEEASAFLNNLEMDPNSYPEQRSTLSNCLAFLDWSSNLPSNDDPTRWVQANIPMAYWNMQHRDAPSASSYYTEKAKRLLNNLAFEKLPELARSRWVSVRLAGGMPAPQTPSSWQGVCLAAQALELYQQNEKHAGQPGKKDPEEKRLKDELLNRIDNLNYETIGAAPARIKAKTSGQSVNPAILILAPLALSLMLLISAMAWWGGKNGIFSFQLPILVTPTGMIQGLMPEPTTDSGTPGVPQVTPTMTMANTVAVEPTPTDTAVPTPTDRPTPVPSIFEVKPDELLIPLGVNGSTMYLIDHTHASFAPDEEWSSYTVAENVQFRYLNNRGNKQDASVEWKFDQPLSTAGLYEVFILDTKANAGMDKALNYQVLSNGDLAELVVGSPSIRLLTAGGDVQTNDLWRSIGIYTLDAGVTPSVRLDVPKDTVTGDYMVGASSVLFSNLADQNLIAGPLQYFEQRQKQVVLVADDTQAEIKHADVVEKQEVPNGNTWFGKSQQIALNGSEVAVTWTLNALPGEYSLQIFVPQEHTAEVSFEITLDGVPIQGLPVVNLPANAGAGGTYFPGDNAGGPWIIKVSDSKPGKLVVKMTASKEATGILAVDALVLSVDKPQ